VEQEIQQQEIQATEAEQVVQVAKPKRVIPKDYIQPSRIKDKPCPKCGTLIMRQAQTCRACFDYRPGRTVKATLKCQYEGCTGQVVKSGTYTDGTPKMKCYVCRKAQNPRPRGRKPKGE
jgi:hypothetical protein